MKTSYYYIDSYGERHGPLPIEYFKQKGINGHTWVWHEGIPHWVEAHTLPPLRGYMDNTLPKSFSDKGGLIHFNEERHDLPGSLHSSMIERNMRTQKLPKSWLIESILAMVLCCVPIGIVAIIYASRVIPLWQKGHYGEALSASYKAEFWVKLAAVFTVLLWVVYIILWMFTPIAEDSVIWYNKIFNGPRDTI